MQMSAQPTIPPVDTHLGAVQLFQTHAAELARRLGKPYPPFAVIDIRPAADFARGSLPGARSSTAAALGQQLPEGITPETEVFVLGSGMEDPERRRAAIAVARHGVRRVVEVTGGIAEWVQLGFPLAAGKAA